MPYSQTKERFLQGISVPRNLSLMRVFQDLEITEKTGHGTVKIISAYGKEVFDIQDGFIQVTIPFNKKVMKNRGTINGNINGNINSDLSKNELSLIGVIIQKPGITLTRLLKFLEYPKERLREYLPAFRKRDVLKGKAQTKTESGRL